jgi:hypothetical protein
MRNLILVILLAVLGSVSLAKADGMPETHIIVRPHCEKCDFYKNAPNTGIKHPVRNMVCFYFNQEGETNVEFTLYSSYDPATKQGQVLRKLKREFGTAGKFCVGSPFVEQAVAVEICNDFPDHPGNHSIREISYLQEGLRTGVVEMCLLGRVCPMYRGWQS